jgi:hypothetical protein
MRARHITQFPDQEVVDTLACLLCTYAKMSDLSGNLWQYTYSMGIALDNDLILDDSVNLAIPVY